MAEFSYFDQFKDVEIDLTSYLNKLTTDNDLRYNQYTFNNKQPIVTNVTNLFSKYDIIFDYKSNLDVITRYTVKDNEFIENVSQETYGDMSFWWIVCLFNDIKDPYRDWPLSQKQIVDLATRLYNTERKFSYDTYVEFIHTKNEEKRNLILPIRVALKDIIWKYREAIIKNG